MDHEYRSYRLFLRLIEERTAQSSFMSSFFKQKHTWPDTCLALGVFVSCGSASSDCQAMPPPAVRLSLCASQQTGVVAELWRATNTDTLPHGNGRRGAAPLCLWSKLCGWTAANTLWFYDRPNLDKRKYVYMMSSAKNKENNCNILRPKNVFIFLEVKKKKNQPKCNQIVWS